MAVQRSDAAATLGALVWVCGQIGVGGVHRLILIVLCFVVVLDTCLLHLFCSFLNFSVFTHKNCIALSVLLVHMHISLQHKFVL